MTRPSGAPLERSVALPATAGGAGSDSPAEASLQSYLHYTRRKRLFLLGSLGLLSAVAAVSLTLGGADLSVGELLDALLSRVHLAESPDPFKTAVVWHLRLPRVVLAVIAGAGLSVSGAAMQAVTRNPLVSPFTVGTSSAAALGASIAILLGAGKGVCGVTLIILGAFSTAMVCATIVFGLSRLRGNSPEALILAGIAMMYLFSALTSMIHFFASEEDLKAMVSWTFGSLSESGWRDIGLIAAIFVILMPPIMRLATDLNIMISSDDESSTSLGVRPSMIRTVVLVCTTLLTAVIISFTGIIGFVGLVAPHITRFIIGGDHRFLMPAAAITGSIVLVAADMAGRLILAPLILPIGIVVSFLGVPLFIYLMMRKTGSYWQ
jgi:iron complex transport system permease protein